MGSVGRMGKRSCVGLGCRFRALCTAVQINGLAPTHFTHITHSTHSTHGLRYLGLCGLWVVWVVMGSVGRMGKRSCVGLRCRCRALCTAVQINGLAPTHSTHYYPLLPTLPTDCAIWSCGLWVVWVVMGSVGRMGNRSVRWAALSLPSALHCCAVVCVDAIVCFAMLCCQMMLAPTHSTHYYPHYPLYPLTAQKRQSLF